LKAIFGWIMHFLSFSLICRTVRRHIIRKGKKSLIVPIIRRRKS
jgi:hypothetical protein